VGLKAGHEANRQWCIPVSFNPLGASKPGLSGLKLTAGQETNLNKIIRTNQCIINFPQSSQSFSRI